ncbi:hypothetical protein L226DRAFT_508810 [Lentinus tigrinus ALCF2SS1-7]|uniref:CCHC-type domain-containing protein n=1 Tax=Lentinus tigrinus ALCF2SS1-6 TaxID=1328759 RepID=A0A5C2SFK3_9APHY|nr:hypothetical protein L227DRAFT_652103 [Lentinus tigrinus ALCF2SS1-6]RPD74436.1 hypothetical protein L226DRAFT_508810 [Lentinus tigrinus ALCF2SS1-7]
MTRYTNFARKRTYVEAGFDTETHTEEKHGNASTHNPDPSGEATTETETKKRKRVRSKKTKISDANKTYAAQTSTGDDAQEDGEKDEGSSEQSTKKSKFGDKGRKQFDKRRQPRDANVRKIASEQRRMKRIDDRNAQTICFACREKGHTARDCTNTLAPDALEGEAGKPTTKSGRDAVGICYRCGSRRHNLSRCKEPVDPENPLPFASCFVCSGKGHLASKCPQNQSKGIYPNGGCCKLCKETTHLAKDCPMRKQEVVATTVFVGTGRESGADEDDFHTFKRMTVEVDKSEKAEEKAKKKAGVKVGAYSGVVRAFGDAPAPKKKKVVFF